MDKATATNEGSTIWQCVMKSWAEQIDELVQDGQYADALALLDVIEEAALPDKVPFALNSPYLASHAAL